MNELVHQHIDTYTPAKQAQINAMQNQIDVNTNRIGNIKEQLDKIESNQQRMLDLLQRHIMK